MVSGRFAVAARQFLVIGLLFGSVMYFISWQQRRVYEQATDALKRLRILQQDNANLMNKGSRIIAESNRTQDLLEIHLKHMETIDQFTKKKNLILRGAKEIDLEDPENTFIDLAKERLKMDISISDIEYAMRVDELKEGEPRPILVRFVRLKDKSKVFYKRKNLPKRISLEEDLTHSQKENPKKLDAYAKRAAQNGKVVKWSSGKLFINGKVVNYNDV